jgi:hypothetical protein
MASFEEDEIKKKLRQQGFNLDGSKSAGRAQRAPAANAAAVSGLDQEELKKITQTKGFSNLDGKPLSSKSSHVARPSILSRQSSINLEKSARRGFEAAALEKLPVDHRAAKHAYVEAATLLSRVLSSGDVAKNSRQSATLTKRLEEFVRKAENLAASLETAQEQEGEEQKANDQTSPPCLSAESLTIDPNLKDLLAKAVAFDRAGKYSEALTIYKTCVGSLYDSLQGIPKSDTRSRLSCATILDQYMERAETLKSALEKSANGGGGGGESSGPQFNRAGEPLENASGLSVDIAITRMIAEGMEYVEIKFNVLTRFGCLLNKRHKKLIQRLLSEALESESTSQKDGDAAEIPMATNVVQVLNTNNIAPVVIATATAVEVEH